MESTSRTNGYQPLDIINVLLLILCLFVFSTPAFAEQAVSRVQFLADSAFYLSSKSDTSIQHLVPHIALPQRDKPGTDFDGNKVRANSKPSMDADHPLIAFQTEYPHARITLHDVTGLPHIISNLQSEARSGSAEQIARDFLVEHRDLLIPVGNIAELELIEVMWSQYAQHVHFQQIFRGIPVYRSVISVHIQDGSVVMYTGKYRPTAVFRSLSLQPGLGRSQATEIAMQQLERIAPVWLRGDAKAHPIGIKLRI